MAGFLAAEVEALGEGELSTVADAVDDDVVDCCAVAGVEEAACFVEDYFSCAAGCRVCSGG